MPDFSYAHPGDQLSIPAGDWNAAMEAARSAAGGRYGRQGAPETVARLAPGLTVLVKNSTGGALTAFQPIRLGSALTGISASPRNDYESATQPCLDGLACTRGGPAAVLAESLPTNAIGRAVVAGVTVARVASGVTAAGQWVGPPASGNTELTLGGTFARVLTTPVGTGGTDRAAVVLIGGNAPDLIPVKQTAATATSGDTYTAGTTQVYDSTPALADGPETVVFKPAASGMLQKSGTVWWCVDTFAVDGSGRRRLVGVVPPMVKRQVQVGCDSGTGAPQFANVWVPDVA